MHFINRALISVDLKLINLYMHPSSLMFIYSLPSFPSCRPVAGVFGPDWQVNQDETILEGGEIGLSVTLSYIGPSVEEVEVVQPCRPRGVMKMTS